MGKNLDTYIFVDTEFTDFINCDLISIGAVTEDGEREFYAEISDYTKEWSSRFVIDTVVPLLDLKTHGMPYQTAAYNFVAWVQSIPNRPHFIVDYVGDYVLIQQLLTDGKYKGQCTTSLLYATVEEICKKRRLNRDAIVQARLLINFGVEQHFTTDNRRHHALVDAKANRNGWITALNA